MDLGGRRDIGLHQGRRYRQNVGDVVEALAGIVTGKQRRGVDGQVEQIADGIGVFGPVEAMQDRSSRIWFERRRTIEGVFDSQSEGDAEERDIVDHFLDQHLVVAAASRAVGGNHRLDCLGEPLRFDGDPMDDDASIEKKVEVVKEAIRALVAEGLAARQGWFS